QDMDGNVEIKPAVSPVHKDSIYNIGRFDSINQEHNMYRELSTLIMVAHHPYHLLLRVSLADIDDLAQGIVTTQVILLVALLAGLLLLNRWQSKKLWRPFYNTVSQLKKFELDKNPALQLDHTRIREFRDLNNAIIQLTDKSSRVYLQQKEFTENAAHEMQTPLAVFQTRLDLLLQSKNLNEEQAGLIQSLAVTTQRLSRLNTSLLLLAKIENRQFIETAGVNVASVIEKMLRQFEEQIRSKHLSLQKQLDEAILINANPTLMEMLISNLLSNAIRHNYDKGTIGISLAGNQLEIENTGLPISFDAAKIFDRFQKDNSNENSIGLGLAIVKQICEVSGFAVEYACRDNRHVFIVSL
ncbi:MAG TPA: HAMP domain-containing sensor histidine kinase, partial [Chitinophagaceae bacterium]